MKRFCPLLIVATLAASTPAFADQIPFNDLEKNVLLGLVIQDQQNFLTGNGSIIADLYSKKRGVTGDDWIFTDTFAIDQDFRSNELRAKKKYANKLVVIKNARITGVSLDVRDHVYATLAHPNQFSEPHAYFERTKEGEVDAENINKGNIVPLVCKARGFFVQTVVLEGCRNLYNVANTYTNRLLQHGLGKKYDSEFTEAFNNKRDIFGAYAVILPQFMNDQESEQCRQSPEECYKAIESFQNSDRYKSLKITDEAKKRIEELGMKIK